MKTFLSFFFLCAFTSFAFAQGTPQVVKRDNGVYGGNSFTKLGKDIPDWDEAVLLVPKGPCEIDEVHVYLDGENAGEMQLWITGDPSEGAVPPTHFVYDYNKLTEPITLQYNGTPGWDTIDVRGKGLRSDGFDRICIMHTVTDGGPYFGLDKTASTGSFLYATEEQKYYYANANFMVRIVVRYDYPKGSGSETAPAATLKDSAVAFGIKGYDNKALKSARLSVADWNGDGWDDVVTAGKFFQNNGNKTFTNVTATIGIDSAGGGYVFGDFNNDGYIDCYSVSGGAGDKIFAGSASGTFTDVTASTKVTNAAPTITPLWFDYDRDGWLDLYISNGRTDDGSGNETYYPDKLWRNKGDGSFEDVTDAAGVSDAETPPYDCWAATVGDYNVDGYPDVFVADYRLQPDMLLQNQKDGSFIDMAEETGAIGVPTVDPSTFGHGAGCEFADLNNDALPDLIVGNLGHPDWRGAYSNPSLIFMNEGGSDFHFAEQHREMGLKFFEMNFGVTTLDLDLDGNLDLFHCQYAYNASGVSGEPYRRSRMYYNEGASKNFHLKDMTWLLGSNVHGAWTSARTDFDHDGDLDLIAASPTDAVRFFKNDVERHGKYLSLRLKGKASDHVNNDAYGSSVTVYADGRKFYRDLMSGGSGTTATQNSNELNFGLGYVSAIDSVVIRWPNGSQWATTTAMKPNGSYVVQFPNQITTIFEAVHTFDKRADDVAAYWNGTSVELEIKSELRNVNISLLDILGNTVQKTFYPTLENGTVALPAAPLSSGMYFVWISSEEYDRTMKVMVVR